MNTLKSGLVFFLLFVIGASLLKFAGDEGLTAGSLASVFVVGLIATGIFAAVCRAITKGD